MGCGCGSLGQLPNIPRAPETGGSKYFTWNFEPHRDPGTSSRTLLPTNRHQTTSDCFRRYTRSILPIRSSISGDHISLPGYQCSCLGRDQSYSPGRSSNRKHVLPKLTLVQLVIAMPNDAGRIETALEHMLQTLKRFREVKPLSKRPTPNAVQWYTALERFYEDVINFTIMTGKYYSPSLASTCFLLGDCCIAFLTVVRYLVSGSVEACGYPLRQCGVQYDSKLAFY